MTVAFVMEPLIFHAVLTFETSLYAGGPIFCLEDLEMLSREIPAVLHRACREN
jgi:hypothetical protein